MRSRGTTGGVIVLALSGCLGSITALADMAQTALLVEVRNLEGSGTMKVLLDDGIWDDGTQKFTWDLPEAKTFVNPVTNIKIGTLKTFKLRVYGATNPRVNVDATFDAGISSTAFIFTPGQIFFDMQGGWAAEGKGRASFSVVDRNNDGVNMRAPGKAGRAMFVATYNGAAPGGTIFTELVGSIAGGPGGSGNVTQSDPAFGYRAIPGSLTDASSQIRLVLSPGDSGEASTRYTIRVYQPGP